MFGWLKERSERISRREGAWESVAALFHNRITKQRIENHFPTLNIFIKEDTYDEEYPIEELASIISIIIITDMRISHSSRQKILTIAELINDRINPSDKFGEDIDEEEEFILSFIFGLKVQSVLGNIRSIEFVRIVKRIINSLKGMNMSEIIKREVLDPPDESSQGGQINKLEWSSDPGAHEAHLIRRHNNPYFPASRRTVSKEDLAEAKRLDNDDYIVCQQLFEELGEVLKAFPPTVRVAEMKKLRERLEDLTRFAMGVGGPAKEIASAADKVCDAVISDIRAAFSDDSEALENIEKAVLFHEDSMRKFSVPVIAQMLRENSPITKDETIFTMLSEKAEIISIFMSTMSEDAQAIILVDALRIMREALHDGYIDPQFEEKLAALEGRWHWTPPKPSDADL